MTVAKQYGRIRVGARIFQDHYFGKWPYCVAPRGSRDEWEADDPDMLFEVRRIERGSDGVCWDCTAHGYGVIGKPDSYGNGGITVSGEDGVELVKHSIPTETEMAQALGLVKRRENTKVQRGSPYIEITMSVRTRDMLGHPRKFVHKVYTISTLEADIEAAKEARRQGFEPWFTLDRKAVS